MKKKIRVKDVNGKIIEGEVTLRNFDHFEIQRKNRAHIFTPKKGKGSFKRNKRVEED